MNNCSQRLRHSLCSELLNSSVLFTSDSLPRLSSSALEVIYARGRPWLCAVLYLSLFIVLILMLPLHSPCRTKSLISHPGFQLGSFFIYALAHGARHAALSALAFREQLLFLNSLKGPYSAFIMAFVFSS